MLAQLIPVDGGAPIIIHQPRVLVGSSPDCDIVLYHQSVSRNHCTLTYYNGQWEVEPFDSESGVRVDGTPSQRTLIPLFSILTIGLVRFEMHYQIREPEQTSKHPTSTPKPQKNKTEPNRQQQRQKQTGRIAELRERRKRHRKTSVEPTKRPRRFLGKLTPCAGGFPMPLMHDKLTIGRAATCDIVIPSPRVSSRHCLMKLIDGLWYVKDARSHNGISINGKRIKKGKLPPGSILGIADQRFEIDYRAANESELADNAKPSSETDTPEAGSPIKINEFEQSLLDMIGADESDFDLI